MPWYDYRCEDCSTSFEARMPVAQRDEAPCPDCGGHRVRRAMPLVVTVVPAGSRKGTGAAPDTCCGGEACGCGPAGGCACDFN